MLNLELAFVASRQPGEVVSIAEIAPPDRLHSFCVELQLIRVGRMPDTACLARFTSIPKHSAVESPLRAPLDRERELVRLPREVQQRLAVVVAPASSTGPIESTALASPYDRCASGARLVESRAVSQ
jgi:hypothetical protein